MIQKRYMDIILQCEARADDLSDWEKDFVFGDPAKNNSVAMKDRQFLSTKQKGVLEKIVVTRFEGKTWDKNRSIKTVYGDVEGVRTEEGYVLRIKGNAVGPGMAKIEVPTVAGWLEQALSDLKKLFKSKEGIDTTPETSADEVQQIIDNTSPEEDLDDSDDEL